MLFTDCKVAARSWILAKYFQGHRYLSRPLRHKLVRLACIHHVGVVEFKGTVVRRLVLRSQVANGQMLGAGWLVEIDYVNST